MNLMKLIPIKKILESEKMRGKICNVIVGTLHKNMGEAQTVKVYQETDGGFCIIAAIPDTATFWRIDSKDFFNIGIPFDIAPILSRMTGGKSIDLSGNFAILDKENESLFLTIYESTPIQKVVFSGDLWAALDKMIIENAESISNQDIGEIETAEQATTE